MSLQHSAPATTRPRQVTVSGFLTLFGSAFALVAVFQAVSELYSMQMSEFLRDLIRREELAAYDITVDGARGMLRYILIAIGVFAGVALVLGWFVLRRDRPARVVLTVMGGLTVLASLLGGPQLWFVSLYVGGAIMLLWSKPARAWFATGGAGSGGSSDAGASRPDGPGRTTDEPEDRWGPPPAGPGSGPPPPPPPPPRQR